MLNKVREKKKHINNFPESNPFSLVEYNNNNNNGLERIKWTKQQNMLNSKMQ